MSIRSQAAHPRTRSLFGIVATVALVVVVVQQSWGITPVNGRTITGFLLAGVALGSIYGVAAQGLVVTYTTSGVFNFAQGAIGMFMAYVYWELKVNAGLPTVVAVLVTVLVIAPVFGVLVDRLLMRFLVDAPLVAQLVVTIGLMLALMGLAASIWNPNTSRTIPRFFGNDGVDIGGTFLPYYRLVMILSGLAIGVGLRFLLYHTRLGLTMRAVVDNRDLTMLSGARPARASMTAWGMGSAMAALAGIFLAEELSALDVTTLTLFIVDAFAAAIIARLRSLPLAYAGGLIIGLTLSFQQNFLVWSGRWTSASNAIPAVILLIALLFVPQGRIENRLSRRVGNERVPTIRRALFGFLVLFVVVLICAATMSRTNVRDVTLALLTAFIMLSMVPLTGWANQISLAQITLMGCGAFAFVEWGHSGNVLYLLVAAAFAVPVGILMAVPALRLQGLYLALTTMAFARLAEFLFFDQPEVFGNLDREVPTLSLFGLHVNDSFSFLGISFSQDAGFLLFATVLFSLVGLFVVWVRKHSFGRRLIALRDSPSACVTVGVNLTMTKLAVFIFSAAIAGLAGGLFAIFYGSVGVTQFQLTVGLPYLLLLAVGGMAVVSGTVFGGIALTSFTWLATIFSGSAFFRWFQNIGPGLAGIGIGHEPDGAVVEWSHRLHRKRVSDEPKVGTLQAPHLLEVPDLRRPTPSAGSSSDAAGSSGPPVLAIENVSVRFGGLHALRGAHIELTEGTITGLIGPNGAGKTTLFNVATGLQEPGSGRVLFAGVDVTATRPHQRARLGISRTFQRLEVFGSLSVHDNVLVAAEMYHRYSGDHSVRPDELADKIIDWIGLRPVAAVRADRLPTGTARLVEIARALASRPRVLLLDEPSSGLSVAETEALATLLRRLTATGIAILLVEHDMGFIMDLCSRIVVLDLGEIIAEGTPAVIQADPRVSEAYLGTADRTAPKRSRQQTPSVIEPSPALSATVGTDRASDPELSPPALQLSGVSAGYGGINAIFDIDLTLERGKVCAVLGPNGAGKSTMLKVASGQIRPSAGTVSVEGQPISGRSSDLLARNGLCVVPEGRGVFPNLTVAENLKMMTYAGCSYSEIRESSFARFPVLGKRQRQLAGTLSGGEQQMLAIARALVVRPRVLLLDELSMGLAPIIVEQLYDTITQIAGEGLSLLIVEQFAHEVLRVADEAALLVNGRISERGMPEEVGQLLQSAYLGGSRRGDEPLEVR